MTQATRWSDKEYYMDMGSEQYFNEKIDRNYHTLDEKIDTLHTKFDEKLDKIHESVIDLKSIVTNGLSHRTKKTEADVDFLRNQMATKDDILTLHRDRDAADSAWKEARRWRIGTIISFGGLLVSIAYLVWR